jgi:hypothetical protein
MLIEKMYIFNLGVRGQVKDYLIKVNKKADSYNHICDYRNYFYFFVILIMKWKKQSKDLFFYLFKS